MRFTEAQLESTIIELLDAESYPHMLGFSFNSEETRL